MNYFTEYLFSKNESMCLIEPKSYWASTDNSIVFEILPNIVEAQGFLIKNLISLAEEKVIPSNFYDNSSNNLYDFLKKDAYIDKICAFFLISNGDVSKAEGGGFKVPNHEILQNFKKIVFPNYYAFELKMEPIINTVCSSLNANLNNDKIFENTINEIIKKIPREEKNEAYFQSVITGLIEAQAAILVEDNAHYYCSNEKTVAGGRIDSYFLPTKKNTYKTFIIHENKVLHEMEMYQDEYTLENAIWQSFCRNYISDPLSKYDDKDKNSTWRYKIRAVLFQYNEHETKWIMKTKTFEFDYYESNNIYKFFLTKMSPDLKNYVSHKDLNNEDLKQNRLDFMKCYEQDNTKGFLELISKDWNQELCKESHDILAQKLMQAKKEKREKNSKKSKLEIQEVRNDLKRNKNEDEENDMMLDKKQKKKSKINKQILI